MKLEREQEQEQVRTNVDFVRHVENTLGFVLDPYKPVWRARQIEAGKLKRKRAKDPGRYTMRNLLITVEYLRRKKQEVKSPAAVCFFVDEALKNARSEDTPTDLELEIKDALAAERRIADEHSEYWSRRLVRATGPGRAEVLQEWRATRG